ncbi:hypothetical protein [Bacteroides acidifaciens]|uniref:hypothetical protein n=1 Tax=Bacteroides acidifaciens TaxID=85831 RepID=UPI002557FE7D|nr:hypothetical protein [Bacteroides acidifaciens]
MTVSFALFIKAVVQLCLWLMVSIGVYFILFTVLRMSRPEAVMSLLLLVAALLQ